MGKFDRNDGKARTKMRLEVIEGQLKSILAMLNQMDNRAQSQGVLIMALGEKAGGDKELEPFVKAAWEKITGQHVPSVERFTEPEPPVPGMGLPMEKPTEAELEEDADDAPEAGGA